MRFLIPLFLLAVMAVTPTQAEARVYVSVSVGGHINVCLARALPCHPSEVVWTPAGWMCPLAYRVYIRYHPTHRRGHYHTARHTPQRHTAHRRNHSRGRNGHRPARSHRRNRRR